jgi:hypothetical protein
MVSGLRLARRSEIVSRAPENMRSTATAEPLETLEWYLEAANQNPPGMESMSRAKQDKLGNCAQRPAHH